MKRFKYYSLLTAFAVIITIVIALITFGIKKFDANSINAYEQRTYKIIEVILLSVITFSLLRLYNAVVGNTTFLTKLVKEFNLMTAEMKTLARNVSNDTSARRNDTNVLKHAMDRTVQTYETLRSAIVESLKRGK